MIFAYIHLNNSVVQKTICVKRSPPAAFQQFLLYSTSGLVYTYGMSGLAKTPDENQSFTYADYKSWELAEGERYELIDGSAYAMAAPNDQHQAISMELARQIANFLQGKPCKVRPAPYDVRLFYEEDESDTTVVQPDISVICDEEKRGPEGCRGAPDLVIEVLSPSNTSEESVRKFNLYLKAGVKEYWIVAPKSKTVQVYVFQDNSYLGTTFDAGSLLASAAIKGLVVSLKEVFAE
jgi:Uma2 family endonuclease